MRILSQLLVIWFLVGVLAGCATLGPTASAFWEGFSGHSSQFIQNHSADYVIRGDRVYPAPHAR